MQVLIIDGSVMIIERLQIILSETENITASYGAVSLHDGERLLQQVRPDIVMLDMNLANNGSVRLLNRIKKSNIKVIALSIHLNDFTEEQQRLMGIDFFVDKYWVNEKLPAIIKNIAQQKTTG
jgi:two-component SAPR family response regulator